MQGNFSEVYSKYLEWIQSHLTLLDLEPLWRQKHLILMFSWWNVLEILDGVWFCARKVRKMWFLTNFVHLVLHWWMVGVKCTADLTACKTTWTIYKNKPQCRYGLTVCKCPISSQTIKGPFKYPAITCRGGGGIQLLSKYLIFNKIVNKPQCRYGSTVCKCPI